jgi:hypothetical protein
MDRELQDYYEDRFAMFASKGWRELIEDIKEFEKAVNTIDSATNGEQLQFRKGQLDMIRFLLNLETVSRDNYDKLVEEKDESVE